MGALRRASHRRWPLRTETRWSGPVLRAVSVDEADALSVPRTGTRWSEPVLGAVSVDEADALSVPRPETRWSDPVLGAVLVDEADAPSVLQVRRRELQSRGKDQAD